VRAAIVTAIACVGGAAAAPMLAFAPAAAPTAAAAASAAPVKLRAVIPRGPDVDGDGAPDFVNPTGKGLRDSDAFGYGAYHASRDEGARLHEGADFLARTGQTVVAPISGYVTKIGYAYADDLDLRYVELTNAATGYMARVFYVVPSVAVGDAVRLGRAIGQSMSLQGRYPGILNHVHVELTRIGHGHVDPCALIPLPVLRPARRGPVVATR
jgi:hypothetical protein